MIARITVVNGTLTEYPLAEKVKGGWQNGVTFYPDEKVTKVVEMHVYRDQPDHVSQARLHIDRASSDVSANWEVQTGELKADILALAQVHATLALVEQQRIANLIALARPYELPNGGDASYMLYDPETLQLQPDIREGLGL